MIHGQLQYHFFGTFSDNLILCFQGPFVVMEKFIDHFMNLELPDGKSKRFVVCEVYILKGLQKIFLERSFQVATFTY